MQIPKLTVRMQIKMAAVGKQESLMATKLDASLRIPQDGLEARLEVELGPPGVIL